MNKKGSCWPQTANCPLWSMEREAGTLYNKQCKLFISFDGRRRYYEQAWEKPSDSSVFVESLGAYERKPKGEIDKK